MAHPRSHARTAFCTRYTLEQGPSPDIETGRPSGQWQTGESGAPGRPLTLQQMTAVARRAACAEWALGRRASAESTHSGCTIDGERARRYRLACAEGYALTLRRRAPYIAPPFPRRGRRERGGGA